MRVSNIGLSNNAILSLQRAAREVEQAQSKTISGRRVERPSDDPTAAASIMSSAASLRALDQYTRNIRAAAARSSSEEQALDQLTQFLTRAKQLGIQEAGSSASTQSRAVAKAEVDQILAAAIQLANTRYNGEYLFGGDQSQTLPITQSTPPFSSAPPTGQRKTEIAEGQLVSINHNATDVFLNSQALAALDELSTALGADDPPGILNALTTLDSAISGVQSLLGEVGAQAALLDTTEQNLKALEVTLVTFKSDLEDVDMEAAITKLVASQSAYQAAMLATSRMLTLTLADYI